MFLSPPLRSPRRFLILPAALALLLLGPAFAAAYPAGKPIDVENIRVGFGEKFKIGAWTPVWVQVRAGVEPFDGLMELISEDESGTRNSFAVIAKVGAGESTRLTAYTRPGSMMGNFTVRFIDKDGNGKGSFSLDSIRPNNPPQALFADEIAILALGKPQGVELVSKVPGLNGGMLQGQPNVPNNSAATAVEVILLNGLDATTLPGRSMGYDGFEAVVIDTNDAEMMETLRSTRGETLKEWVGQGGHLVITVGQNWQKVKDSPLGSILPATPTGRTTITDLRTIESFAGAKDPLVAETGASKTQLTITKLEGVDRNGTRVLCTTATSPIVVRGSYGFGRVTVIALDVDSKPFSTWTDRGLFWVKALDLHPTSASVGNAMNRARFNQYGVSDLSAKLRETLEQFEGVKLIPFGWVAFFIFLYILLIGPGDYFFLRKVLKRMELTWITFPTIVVLVSAGAYFAAYKMKGTELRLNQIDFIDVDITSKSVRGTSFVGLFSPQNRDYDVSIVPMALNVGGKTPTGETRISWFGSPEQGPRGMNGGGQPLSFGSGGYQYNPVGQASKLTGVRIPIWSTKEFTARWFTGMDGEPIVESDLTPNGFDRVNGTITNRLDVPLKNAVLAYSTQIYYNLGTIAPGATVRVELTQDRKLSGHLRDLQAGYYEPNGIYQATTSNIDRYKLGQAILFRESDTSGVNPLTNRPLNYLDLTGQLLLDRPMLVAEVDRPFSELNLGESPTAPKTSRTSILRVILPLGNPPAPAKPAVDEK